MQNKIKKDVLLKAFYLGNYNNECAYVFAMQNVGMLLHRRKLVLFIL